MQRGVKLDALDRLYELSVRHGSPEQRAKLQMITAGVMFRGYKQPEHDVFTDEIVAILFERVFAELAELRAMVQGLAELDSAGPIPKKSRKGENLSPSGSGSSSGAGKPAGKEKVA